MWGASGALAPVMLASIRAMSDTVETRWQRRKSGSPHWQFAYRVLTALFLLTAVLNMAHVRGGFLTNHLADLACPAWLYVVIRGLVPMSPRARRVYWWVGRSPERAAVLLFLGSTATEVSQLYWPRGLFSGRFDPWDIVAYGAGLLPVYWMDRKEMNRSRDSAKWG